MSDIEVVLEAWEARAAHDVGVMIGRYLRENPPPAESGFAVRLAACGQGFLDAGKRDLARCGVSDERGPTDDRARMWNLATRVHGVIANEAATPHAAIERYLSPRRTRGGLNERELALCDWGVAFGVALGFSLAENPPEDTQEPIDACYGLACEIADIVEQHHGGAIPPRPSMGEAIDRVITAFTASDHLALALSGDRTPELVKLHGALQALTETYGAPWNGMD